MKIIDIATSRRAARAFTIAMSIGSILLLAAGDASAQSLKATGVSIFNMIYSTLGVIAGIALLVQIINWKAGNFLGSQDPKKLIVQTLIATCLGFGVVGIIQGIKSYVGGNADIGSV